MADRSAMPYRPCVGIAVFNREGKVFIGRRRTGEDPENSPETSSPWQMPQGGIDQGEEPLAAARRELFEETNIRSVRLLAQTQDWIFYDLPDELLGVAFRGKYRGQRQLWLAFLFTGEDTEIDVAHPGDGSVHAEFEAWRWEDLAQLPDIIVPFKREVYLKVAAEFAGLPDQIRTKA